MAENVVVGGFGSSPEHMEYIAARIGDHLGERATGICFREASNDKRLLADLIEGSTVFTHSGGIKPIIDSAEKYLVLPEKIVSIAIPVREQVRKLLVRGALIGTGRIGTDEQMEELERKFTATSELLHHPIANFARIPALGNFHSIAELGHLSQEGVDTTIALMKTDGMFNNDTEAVRYSVLRARGLGSTVVTIAGGHCRFTLDPEGTLRDIESASMRYRDAAMLVAA